MAAMASFVRAGATPVGLLTSRNFQTRSGAHGQPRSVAVTAPRTFQVVTSFSGQSLARKSTYCPLPTRRSKRAVVRAHGGSSTPGMTGSDAESILDDLSRFLYRKANAAISPHLPQDFDPLAWLPDGIHDKVHSIEGPAIILLREFMHFSLFYFLFIKVDSICRAMSWFYATNIDHKREVELCYENSVFQAMTQPLRFLTVVWAATRFAHVVAPLLKLKMKLIHTSKLRSIGLVVAVTWFFFKWKSLYVDKLVKTYKLDAPRIVAFDKIVSLLMYFVALSFFSEVTGFALRSLLAVGGFSGVALGLAAKEIVSNFFGGAVLLITRPFVIGDVVKTGQISGYVEDIGFLQTKILSQERVPMIVPNQTFINQVITNFSRASQKLLEAEFPIRMQDIFLVDRITSKVVNYLRSVPDVDIIKLAPACYLKSIGAGNNMLVVTCVLRHAGGPDYFKAQQTIFVHIAEIIITEGAMIGSNSSFGVNIPDLVPAVMSGGN